jgi:hypothetical protein
LTQKNQLSDLLGQIARASSRAAYSGGMAILAFIDNAATTTARQSENAPKASDAATASINRGEATLALRPLKPCAPGERIMAKIPGGCGRITAVLREPSLFRLATLRQFRAGFAAGVNGR